MENWILVEFCPCGHTANVKKNTILPSVLREIESGKRLSAPMKHSSECPQCEEDFPSFGTDSLAFLKQETVFRPLNKAKQTESK